MAHTLGEAGGASHISRSLTSKRLRLIVTLVFGVFLFICSLEGVKSGFKLVFAQWQRNILALIEANTAPVTGLALGMLGTALVQSSSAVIAATMVSMYGMVSGGLPLFSAMRFGVPLVLGANFGTTITNTIVIFGVKRGMTDEEFRSTIPGVIVDDVYEFLTIILFFTLEMANGLISRTVTSLGCFYAEALNLEQILSTFDRTIIDILVEEPIVKPVTDLVNSFAGKAFGGVILFVIWFLVIILSLSLITRGLHNIIEAEWEDKVVSAFRSPFRGFTTGFSVTWLVGSSSIGTSLVIPFLATKMVDLERAYPYLTGCNMATTVDLSQIYGYFAGGLVGLMLGSAHVLLNFIAILLWLVSPLRFLPVKISEEIGERMVVGRSSALSLLLWVILIFFILPIIIIYLF